MNVRYRLHVRTMYIYVNRCFLALQVTSYKWRQKTGGATFILVTKVDVKPHTVDLISVNADVL